MMKIQYASDLHLEFKENVDWFLENPIIRQAIFLCLPEILPISALSCIPNIHSGIGAAATSIRLLLSPAIMNCTAVLI